MVSGASKIFGQPVKKKKTHTGLDIDLKQLAKDVEQNRKERLDLIKKYAEHILETSDEKWGEGHKILLDSQYPGLRKAKAFKS